jgi:HSP20 family molecular chaperone IbpA
MAIKKRSFFERLSGTAAADDFESFDDDFLPQTPARRVLPPQQQPGVHIQSMAQSQPAQPDHSALFDEEPMEGQLPVDVYQTPGEIVIRTFIAGVRPDEMNVSISRDMVTIEGSREERTSVVENDYFHHELFWGSFARTILLLTIILPKLDKARQTKLRIKAG